MEEAFIWGRVAVCRGRDHVAEQLSAQQWEHMPEAAHIVMDQRMRCKAGVTG